MSAIELLLRLAKIREDQAMARVKRATGEVNQTIAFKNQVLEYAKDYEVQMIAGGDQSVTVAFIQDANAFREKLIHSSIVMDGQIQGLTRASEGTLKTATEARMRTLGLTKLVDKIKLEAKKKRAKAEMNQFEDNYAARASFNSGTKDA
jgi:flagellar biosynthesis chaperone FliJ